MFYGGTQGGGIFVLWARFYLIISVHCHVSQMRERNPMRPKHIFVIWSCIRVNGEISHE